MKNLPNETINCGSSLQNILYIIYCILAAISYTTQNCTVTTLNWLLQSANLNKLLKSNINAYSRMSEIQLVLIMIKYIFIYIYMKYKISSWDDVLWQGKVWTKRCNHPGFFYVQASTLFRPWIHLGYIACNFVEMFLVISKVTTELESYESITFFSQMYDSIHGEFGYLMF